MLNNVSDFCPDWSSPPGDTILELLEERELSIEDFSKLIEETVSVTSNLLTGRGKVTPDLARKLSNVLGASTEFWLARDYNSEIVLEKPIDKLEWYKKLPLADMKKFGHLLQFS